ncbi:UNVERIFIED_CONTAM: hypothetical protein BEN50_15045 [Euhalothece sp. KZN 001]
MIILPGDPLFQLTLDTMPPPGWHSHQSDGNVALVKDLESGLLRPATPTEMFDYAFGGELEEVEEKFGEGEENADY